jgi:hypothetical protein
MTEVISHASSPRSRVVRLLRGLGLLMAGLAWFAVLPALWWWLPVPSRATLSTSDNLLLVGFAEGGQTLVTIRPLRPEKETIADLPGCLG